MKTVNKTLGLPGVSTQYVSVIPVEDFGIDSFASLNEEWHDLGGISRDDYGGLGRITTLWGPRVWGANRLSRTCNEV